MANPAVVATFGKNYVVDYLEVYNNLRIFGPIRLTIRFSDRVLSVQNSGQIIFLMVLNEWATHSPHRC